MELSLREIERLRERQRIAREIAAPFIEAKVALLNRTLPSYLLHSDGTMETIYPAEVTEALDGYDKMALEAVKSYLGR